MDCAVNVKALRVALSAAGCVCPRKCVRPIFTAVKLRADARGLELVAHNGEQSLIWPVSDAAPAAEGACVVNAELLHTVLGTVAGVEVQLRADANTLHVAANGATWRLPTPPAEDFPPDPVAADSGVLVGASTLHYLLQATAIAAARESSRYALNGIALSRDGETLRAAATDGRRLHVAQLKPPGPPDKPRALLPLAAADALARLVGIGFDEESPADVSLLWGERRIVATWGGKLFATQQLEGTFPDYEKIVPRSFPVSVTCDRAALDRALHQAACVCTEDSRAVRLAFSGSEIAITSNSPERGGAAVRVPATCSGTMECGYNPHFLRDALAQISAESVRIDLGGPHAPTLLCGDEDRERFYAVVMPVALP